MSVAPAEVPRGGRVEVRLNDAARARDASPGYTFLRAQRADGQWTTEFVLTSGYPGTEDYDGEAPTVQRVERGERVLFTDFPVEFETETVRVPAVRPGTYQLAKVLHPEGEPGAFGFGTLPAPHTPLVTAEIQVMR